MFARNSLLLRLAASAAFLAVSSSAVRSATRRSNVACDASIASVASLNTRDTIASSSSPSTSMRCPKSPAASACAPLSRRWSGREILRVTWKPRMHPMTTLSSPHSSQFDNMRRRVASMVRNAACRSAWALLSNAALNSDTAALFSANWLLMRNRAACQSPASANAVICSISPGTVTSKCESRLAVKACASPVTRSARRNFTATCMSFDIWLRNGGITALRCSRSLAL